ncbi:hypothetical protein [Kocuria tytonis]|uniref:Uncharacterized protein n=1 Tax=Kocuria tytonis TaxID=2054280 RepID=A0A495A9B5_9MICC|nr:hypothetical protein [Kocuria tytonis]RKQ35117.1 hypothetical protein C1C97_007610 [Kocuria tytonis]
MTSEMKFSVTLTAVGLLGFLASYGWLLWDARDPVGGANIGAAMMCMLTAGLAVAGLLCMLAVYLSRFIVGRDD